VLASLCLTATAASARSAVEVFVLAGQSNMSGGGLPLTLASPTNARLLIWRGDHWEVAADPLAPPLKPGSTQGIGPGMTFGLQLLKRQPGIRVGLIMCAQGGSSMEEWDPSGPLYAACTAQIRATGSKIAGTLFLQGESEARTVTKAAAWLPGFTRLFAAFRKDTNRAPFVLGQIGTLDPKYEGQQLVRDAQAEAAKTFGLPLVRTADLPTDGLHFTVPAYRVIGARFAVAWWGSRERLLKEKARSRAG
jgi:hypothetical protein